MQISDFCDISKVLIISRLNFADTYGGAKTGLKGLNRACKRATVASKLWPFRLLSVALLQVRRARMSKSAGFSGSLKPVFRSGWRILVEVFLLIFFVVTKVSLSYKCKEDVS